MEFMPILKGTPVSSGIAEGVVVIVDRHDFMKQDFEEGSILVTEMTEPSMILMMNKASAIVLRSEESLRMPRSSRASSGSHVSLRQKER